MRRRYATLFGVLVLVMGIGSVAVTPVSADNENMIVKAAKGKAKPALLPIQGGVRTMPQVSSATVNAAQKAPGLDEADVRADNTPDSGPSDSLGLAVHTVGCSDRNSDGNVRVNQDCTYRRQAEEMIRYFVNKPSNLVAGQNDSRVGFNKCGFDYSFDSGRTWGDGIPPFYQRLNNPAGDGIHTVAGGAGTQHTYDAGSDPALATDANGQSFYSCVLFDVNSNASAIVVTSSPQGAGGSFYNNVPAAGSRFIVAEDNNPAIGHDKEFIVADNFASSPNKNNVYVTWTVFKSDPRCISASDPSGFCESPIYGSMSTDHANNWSAPEQISGTSATLCFFGNFFDPTLSPHSCNFDQGSDPQPKANGDLVVVFNNGNTPATTPNSQQLSVLCHPTGSSTPGTAGFPAHLNCASPAKVGDDVTSGEPQCNFGRGPEECIPGAFIRTNDFPRIAIDRQNGDYYATWQDYRNGEFDIQVSRSTDGGLTWHEGGTVNPDRGRDHYFAAIDVATSGGGEDAARNADHVGVSYYRTDRVANENTTPKGGFAPGQPGVMTGNSDYNLSGGRALDTPYNARRISPEFAPPDGNQAGFNGDYSGLVVIGNTAHPIWSDTRNASPATQGQNHDEDIFSQGIALPDGRGEGGGD